MSEANPERDAASVAGQSNVNEESKLDETSTPNVQSSVAHTEPDATSGQINQISSNIQNDRTPAQNAEARKLGSFPGDLSTIKPIFSMKSKTTQSKERFSQKAQEYLDSHKMSIYLQDAIKIILDRREEKPLDLLTD